MSGCVRQRTSTEGAFEQHFVDYQQSKWRVKGVLGPHSEKRTLWELYYYRKSASDLETDPEQVVAHIKLVLDVFRHPTVHELLLALSVHMRRVSGFEETCGQEIEFLAPEPTPMTKRRMNSVLKGRLPGSLFQVGDMFIDCDLKYRRSIVKIDNELGLVTYEQSVPGKAGGFVRSQAFAQFNDQAMFEYYCPKDTTSLVDIQDMLRQWVTHNFREQHGVDPLESAENETMVTRPVLGAMEELGELSHALLKMLQGIRGSRGEHEAAAKDAIGDVTIYLIDVCNALGWSFEEILKETLGTVLARDWKANATDGRSSGS